MSRGIFCVEGQWDRDLRKRGSVLPTLELLERLGTIRFIHKDVATADELNFYLDRWVLREYADYNVGFFAMHGEPTRLCLTDWESVELEEIADRLAGKLDGKRLFFGSCSVMNTGVTQLQKFLITTGAAMMCGYTRAVDWVQSAAFETVLLDVLANGQRSNSVELRMGSAQWAQLSAYLGFRIVYNNGRTWRVDTAAKIPAQANGR
jgi:hypothetical protein